MEAEGMIIYAIYILWEQKYFITSSIGGFGVHSLPPLTTPNFQK